MNIYRFDGLGSLIGKDGGCTRAAIQRVPLRQE